MNKIFRKLICPHELRVIKMNKCSKCGSPMKIISREQELMECDVMCGIYNMTEGQMGDYMAAEMSGDYGDWTVNIVTYKCSKCGKTETVKYI